MFNQKKIMAVLMLLVVTMPLFFYVGFLARQKLIQYEMEERLENNFLQTITIDRSEIAWVKKNKEVIINGKLFDVKSTTITGNKIKLTGLFDEDESKLKTRFANIIHRKKNESTPFEKFIIKFIFASVLSKSEATSIIFLGEHIKSDYPFFDEAIFCQSLPVNTPPPNV